MGCRTARMHNPLGDPLVIEVRDFFAQDEIFKQGGSAPAAFQRVLIVGDGESLVSCEGDTAARSLVSFTALRGRRLAF